MQGRNIPDALTDVHTVSPPTRHHPRRSDVVAFLQIVKSLFTIVAPASCLLLFSCSSDQRTAFPPGNTKFISPSWLHDHLQNPSLVLLHIGEKGEYDSAHIDGARFITLSDVAEVRNRLRLELPPVARLDSVFESFGISDGSMIVLYWGNDWVSPTTRVFFTLDYLGLGSRTVILDGGMRAWRARGYSVTASPPPAAQRGFITPRMLADNVIDGNAVSRMLHKRGISIIDTRTADFYDGSNDGRGRIPRPGHIPGARNIPFVSVMNDDTTVKDSSALATLFGGAGVEPGDEVVTYCHIGQQATLVYVIAQELGYKVRLYDGSFDEWGKNEDYPVEQ
jgi:thiosulfate/3-mercaptopyruvate sulfurtransferase